MNVKFIPQLDSSDCGAACLCMIANALGSRPNLAKIREHAGTDRNGTNLAGMVSAAEKIGFNAKAMKGERQFFTPDLPVPFIAHVKLSESMNHYVVVEKVTDKAVVVVDPSAGKSKQPLEAFFGLWTGFTIFLNPTPDFKIRKEEKGRLRKFFPLFTPHIRLMAEVILGSALLVVLGILGSFYFRYLVDDVLVAKAEVTLHVLSLGILLLTLFQTLLGAVRTQMLTHFSIKTGLTLNFTYLKHVLSLPLRFFESRKVGEILSRFSDSAKIRGILSNAALSVLMDVLMMVVAGFFLFFQSATLFWVSLITVPLSTGIIWAFARFFRENYRTQMAQEADSQSFMVETLNGMATIKGLNGSDQAFLEIERRITRQNKTAYKASVVGNIQGILVGLIDGWGGNVLFWVGSYFILKDQMSLGELMSFNALLGYFLGPVKRLLGLQPAIQEALVAADRLGEIMELEPEVDASRKLLQPERFAGKIEIKDVTFRYGTKRPVLENVSLSIQPGWRIGLVGPSGCGKSTLVKLLMKFYSPEKGDILIDDYNLLDVDTLNLRSKIGYVPQEVFLFSGTVRDNISIHKPDASLEEVIEAAKRAQAHQFIGELPERYDTILAERGTTLSGGERQRIALARALLGKPQILIFDEATSSLDSLSERAVQETISSLADEGLTTVMIAHRLSTVISCDRIFVMEKGRVVEEGNHFEMVKRGGPYSKLWEGQKG